MTDSHSCPNFFILHQFGLHLTCILTLVPSALNITKVAIGFDSSFPSSMMDSALSSNCLRSSHINVFNLLGRTALAIVQQVIRGSIIIIINQFEATASTCVTAGQIYESDGLTVIFVSLSSSHVG